MLHCSVCKSVLKPTDIFCGNCGTKNDGFEKEQNVEVRTRSACISCKRSIAAADLFCGNCGTKNTAFENCTTVSKEAIPTQDFALPPQSTDDKMEATIPTLQIFESPIQETQSDALTSQCDAASQNDTLEKETAQPQQEDGLYKDICAQIATLASDIEVLQGGNALEQVVARMDGLDTTVDRLTPKIDSLENNLGTIADGITLLDSNLTRLQVELVPTVQDLSQSVVAQKEIFANESVALTNVLS
ncbi:MAG: zinc ribbon domain-containing protein, partial [Firmicutes bacterium]|nr:zinc ribbon domain-containing protein [Bacillota bacterium]